jgi:hypothetical protein
MLAELKKLFARQGSANTAVTAFTCLAQQWRVRIVYVLALDIHGVPRSGSYYSTAQRF